MSSLTMADVPLIVVSDNSSSERRITPAWTIGQLKTKLEPVTGVPPSAQRIYLKTLANERIAIEAADEETTQLSSFPLAPYAELNVSEPLCILSYTSLCPVLRFLRSFGVLWNFVLLILAILLGPGVIQGHYSHSDGSRKEPQYPPRDPRVVIVSCLRGIEAWRRSMKQKMSAKYSCTHKSLRSRPLERTTAVSLE